MRLKRAVVLASLVVLFSATHVSAAEPEGTLVFEVRSYESDVELKKNVKKQLEHGALEWGFHGNELVIPMIAKKYVKPELSHTTRWGETDEVTLAPGEYRITFIGYEQRELSRNPDKILSESAYFNEAILTFNVRAATVTKLEVTPRFRKTGTLIKVFLPALRVRVLEDGAVVSESIISERTAQSIPWDDYAGPLKF